MIVSFGDRATEDVFDQARTARTLRFGPELARSARQRMEWLDRSSSLADLGTRPGNRVEPLKGDLVGLWSMRVNRQWRLVFRWDGGDAYDVRLVDYHK